MKQKPDNKRHDQTAKPDHAVRKHPLATKQGNGKRFCEMIEHLPLSVQIFDAAGSTIMVNESWEQMWGIAREEAHGYNIFKDPQIKSLGLMPYIEKAFKKKSIALPIKYYDPAKTGYKGRGRWIEGYIYPIDTEDGPFEVALIHNDITERKQIEEELRDREERLHSIAEFMPQKMFTATPEGDVDYCNLQWTSYSGQRFEQLMGVGWQDLIHPDDIDEHKERWQYSIDTGEDFELEMRLRRHDNRYHWHLTRARPLRNEAGVITSWIGSSTDIDDSKRTTQRKHELEVITAGLKEQRRQLVELNDAKDEFISLASHQLRTPATGVKQYLGMLLEGFAGNLEPTQRAFLEQAYESNERQLTIVDDLLQVAQVDSGKVMLHKEKINLVHLIKDVLHEQSNKFADRQQTITFKPPQNKMVARIDGNRLRMVLENIIDNASKYTPEGKRISVTLKKTRDNITISIADQGVGINMADADKVFEKFSRLHNTLSLSGNGSGLGLYWAKRIVDLHGGTITIDSQLGKGATFTIWLPRQ